MPMEGAVAAAERVPFNAVDEMVHLLDTEAEPWSIQLEVRVAGALDEDRLRTALGEALHRHPMARARKAPTGSRSDHQYRWEITAKAELDPLRVVDCLDDEALHAARCELQSRSVPLAESPPLRMWLARNPDGDVLMVNANHAAMDGFGTLRFVRSVARAYAQEPDPVPDVDPLEARSLETLVGGGDEAPRPDGVPAHNGGVGADGGSSADPGREKLPPAVDLGPGVGHVREHAARPAEDAGFERDALVHAHVVLDLAVATDHRPGVDHHVLRDGAVPPDGAAGENVAEVPDPGAGPDPARLVDVRGLVDHDAGLRTPAETASAAV